MSIQVGPYMFEGPYQTTAYLADRPGIYAILGFPNDQKYVIDIGESHSVKTRIETHDRTSDWASAFSGPLAVAVLYTPTLSDFQRKSVEYHIRHSYYNGHIPCGAY